MDLLSVFKRRELRNPGTAEGKIGVMKILIDLFKHVTVVSSGATVVIPAYIDKVLPTHRGKALVVLALLGFVVCILYSLISIIILTEMIASIHDPSNDGDFNDAHYDHNIEFLFEYFNYMIVVFAASIVLMTLYTIINIW